jgi:tagatose 6-phosphate kinase
MIVCLGTTPALSRTMEFDRLKVDGVNRATRVVEYAAGKAVNAARAATTLGESGVVCISPVGGFTGNRFEAVARQDPIEHEFVRVEPDTRLCVTVVDRLGRTSTELIEESAALAEQDSLRFTAAFEKRIVAGSVCVLSGSIAPGVPADLYERCTQLARAAGGRIILDATGEPLQQAIAARPDVVKINAGELASVQDGDGDRSVVVDTQSLAKQTGGWVIVTRGRNATIAAHADGETLEASVAEVEVVSAIGSGDSFAGALAVALWRGAAMAEALRLASAAASANAMTALAAHFDVDVVHRLMETIVVREIDR